MSVVAERCPTCGSRYITWSPARIIEACQAWAMKHGGAPPSVKDWDRATPQHPARTAVYRQFGSWNAMVVAAGYPPRLHGGNRRWTRAAAVATLTPWVYAHGRLPKRREWRSPAEGRPTSTQVEGLFGSWNAYIVACGYEPRKAYRTLVGYQHEAGARQRQLEGAA